VVTAVVSVMRPAFSQVPARVGFRLGGNRPILSCVAECTDPARPHAGPVTSNPTGATDALPGPKAPEPVLDGDGTAFPAEPPALHPLDEVDDELRWTFHERRGWLIGIGVNLVVAGIWVGYTHYQPHSHDSFRIAGIAAGVALWVLANVVTTNQLGADAERVAHNLEHGRSVAHELALKNAALATLLLPLTVVVSVGTRLALDRWRAIPHSVILDLAVVVIWMGMGNVVSALLPYRPIRLVERWQRRRSWLRWILCLAVPYALYYVHRWIVWPMNRFDHHHDLLGDDGRNLMAYSLLALGWSLVVWSLSLGFVRWYSTARHDRLDRDLHRPD
jgi:hypothetical protein